MAIKAQLGGYQNEEEKDLGAVSMEEA